LCFHQRFVLSQLSKSANRQVFKHGLAYLILFVMTMTRRCSDSLTQPDDGAVASQGLCQAPQATQKALKRELGKLGRGTSCPNEFGCARPVLHVKDHKLGVFQ
jgi:hypothetical protein